MRSRRRWLVSTCWLYVSNLGKCVGAQVGGAPSRARTGRVLGCAVTSTASPLHEHEAHRAVIGWCMGEQLSVHYSRLSPVLPCFSLSNRIDIYISFICLYSSLSLPPFFRTAKRLSESQKTSSIKRACILSQTNSKLAFIL